MSDSFRGVFPGIIRFRGWAGKLVADGRTKKSPPGRGGQGGLCLQARGSECGANLQSRTNIGIAVQSAEIQAGPQNVQAETRSELG